MQQVNDMSGLRLLPLEDWTIGVSKDGGCVAVGAWSDSQNQKHYVAFDPAERFENNTHYALRGASVIREPF